MLVAVLQKEFGHKPRARWFYLRRLLYVALSGLVILLVFVQQWAEQTTKAGLTMFEWLSLIAVGSAGLLAPYLAAATIVAEKEGRTLGLLLLTDIPVGHLLASKMLAALTGALLTVASVMPLFILCVSLGGIQLEQVLLAFPVLVTTVLGGICLGLWLATLLEREVHMPGYVALVAVLYFVCVPAVVYLVCLVAGLPAGPVLIVISPGAAMYTIKLDQHLGLVGWNCLFNVVGGLPFLVLSRHLLPRLYRGPTTLGARLRRRLGLARRRRPARRPAITGNPLLWKDLHVHYGGERGSWVKCLWGCGLTVVAVGAVYVLVAQLPFVRLVFDAGAMLWWALLGVVVLCALNYLYGTLGRAAQCFSREKHGQTLELLLTTDVSDYALVMGKSNAISMALLPWTIGFGCSAVMLLFLTLLTEGLQNFTHIVVLAAVMINLVCMVFAYEYLAMYISLSVEQYPTATSLVGFVAWYVVGNLVWAVLAIPLFFVTLGLGLIAAPVAGPIIVGHVFRRRVIKRLHELALRRPPATERRAS